MITRSGWFILISFVLYDSLHAQMYDPFQKTAKLKPSSQPLAVLPPPKLLPPIPVVIPTTVSAVMNDKAFINGGWYRIGEKVNQQEVAYIQNGFVGLKEGNRLTVIRIGSNRRVLNTKDIP